MTDELERLQAAFRAAPAPAPQGAARAKALAAAAAAFEASEAAAKKSLGAGQEVPGEARLRSNRANGLGQLLRRYAMKLGELTSPRMAMMGGASLAALALAMVFVVKTPELGDYLDFADGPAGVEDPAVLETAEAPAEATGGLLGTLNMSSSDPGADAIAARPAPPSPPPSPSPSAAAGASATLGGHQLGLSAAAPRMSPADMQRLRVREMVTAESGQAPAKGLIRAAPSADAEAPQTGYQEQGRDRFEEVEDNPVKLTREEPVSTFSIDVDTASYAVMRKWLNQGVLPPKDSVRVEELVNYFSYDYAAPDSPEPPFATHISVFETPWNAETKLLRIGIKGYEIPQAERPAANLVFLIDTSGSMNAPDKLPLLLNAFRLLVDRLGEQDRVSIVTYAGSAGTVLEPTPASEKGKILAALDRLSAGGSTAGGEGIRQAYALAETNKIDDGVNRVILATDGDFNVGIRSTEELESFVERKRAGGVMLSVIGFGRGNYNDVLMQALAQNGNGQAAYIDTLSEARKVLGEEASGTLFPIAQDVKIQIEFNPAEVAEYRLIGYETRALAREDFNNDKVDAGEIGSGHRVTALYEITPVGSQARLVDDLRYGAPAETGAEPEAETGAAADPSDELAFLKIRYKQPGADESQLITRPVTPADAAAPGTEARFAAAVAAFGQLLRGGEHLGSFDYADVAELARGARGEDEHGYRSEFLQLVKLAETAAALERQR